MFRLAARPLIRGSRSAIGYPATAFALLQVPKQLWKPPAFFNSTSAAFPPSAAPDQIKQIERKILQEKPNDTSSLTGGGGGGGGGGGSGGAEVPVELAAALSPSGNLMEQQPFYSDDESMIVPIANERRSTRDRKTCLPPPSNNRASRSNPSTAGDESSNMPIGVPPQPPDSRVRRPGSESSSGTEGLRESGTSQSVESGNEHESHDDWGEMEEEDYDSGHTFEPDYDVD